jgi:hypothetical protein
MHDQIDEDDFEGSSCSGVNKDIAGLSGSEMGSVNPSSTIKKVGQKGTSPISDREENTDIAL